MNRISRLNWFVLFALFVIFAVAGTVAGLAAIVLSGHLAWFTVSIVLALGFYACSALAIHEMELC